MAVETEKQTREFQTEVRQLLDLMIHSLYSNKEIFLRELISNAADAADKLKFEALTNKELYGDDHELKIRVAFDEKKKTVTISDNGIGMSQEEVIENLGTIAKSGTKAFLETLTGDQAKDSQLIGQFGVGFYSSYIVADNVTVITRRAGAAEDEAVRWESDGKGEYTIEGTTRDSRGTDVILHLKKDAKEFLDNWKLRSIITKYSDHIAIPIVMKSNPMPAAEGEEPEAPVDETVNKASALWTRPKKEIKSEDYEEFYKHIAHDFEGPLAYTHNQLEGKLTYKTLLYIPKRAPFDLWDRDKKHGLKLYVRRVFIMDDAENLMPRYLRFVKGVVDSDDLPLNISREILQQNAVVDKIRGASVKKVLGLLEKMADKEPEKYAEFWKTFGRVLKEGPGEDFANKENIAKLLRFASTYTDSKEQNVSLDDYISRMKEGQDKIYYIATDSFESAKNSPHLEVFRKKGVEVLLMFDPVDQWLASHLTEYEEKKFQSVAKGELDLGELEDKDEKEELEKSTEAHKDFLEKLKESLEEKVKEVRVTNRLTESPSCLVVGEYDMAVPLQRMLKNAGQGFPQGKPIMEINPDHFMVKMAEKNQEDSEQLSTMANLLFDQAMLVEGGQLDDPATFIRQMNKLVAQATGGNI